MDPEIKDLPRTSERAYDLIAAHYDGFTGHHDYDRWLDSLLPALRARGLSGNRLLDAGCGTGKSSIPMLERGWDVTAVDQSQAMLDRLRAKVGDGIETRWADIRDLPDLGPFDLILSLGDVLNYCAAEGPLTPVFGGFRRNLAPGGLLLFDLNTVTTYRTFYSSMVEVSFDGQTITWRGQGDGTAVEGDLAESLMEVPGDDGIPVQALHRQRHVPREEVLAALAKAGLRCLDIFGQGFDAVLEVPLEERRHTKAVYIAGADANMEEGR